MNITLRKANAIQNSINEMLKTINVTDTVNLNEFEDAEAKIASAQGESQCAYQRQVALVEALYDIRSNVASANNNAGITEMLTKVAHLDKLIAINQKMADRAVRMSPEVIAGKLNKIRNSKDEGRSLVYDRYNEVSTGIVTDAMNQSFKEVVADHRREKQRLQDAILEANVRTEIILDVMTENTLRTERLV
jgi:hypothetical protein